MKAFLSILVILASVCSLRADWAMESMTSPYTATNDHWRVTLSKIDNTNPNITNVSSLPGNPDPSTLDVEGLFNMPMKDSEPSHRMNVLTMSSTDGDVGSITTVIVATNTYSSMRLSSLSNLADLRTKSEENPYLIRVSSLPEYAFLNTKLASVNEFVVGSVGKQAFRNTKVGEFILRGNFSSFASSGTFQECPNLTNLMLYTSSPFTAIKNSDFNSSGMTFAYFPDVTSIDTSAFNGCGSLTDAVFPSVTSFGSETAFGSCSKLENVVFGTTNQITISGKNFRSSFGSAVDPKVIINTKVTPVFAGSLFFFVDANAKMKLHVRKEAGWKTVNDYTHCAVVEESDGKYYFRSGVGATSWQKEMVFMDIAINLNVQMGGDTVFKTIISAKPDVGSEYTMPRLMILPPGVKIRHVQSDTAGVTASIVGDGDGVHVSIPASIYPTPDENETKDLVVNVSFDTSDEPVSKSGLVIIVR